jgi:hypothetical protein
MVVVDDHQQWVPSVAALMSELPQALPQCRRPAAAFGYRRLHVLLLREWHVVNRKERPAALQCGTAHGPAPRRTQAHLADRCALGRECARMKVGEHVKSHDVQNGHSSMGCCPVCARR